jgi:hypothetical protein
MSSSEKYGIAIALVGMAMAVIQGMTGVIPPLLGWPIVAGCLIAATALIVRGKRGRQELSSQETASIKSKITGRLEDVSPVESEFILAMSIELESIHGWNDLTGLFADRASGIPLNELKTRPCSQCGVPRNQRGNHHE